ncbi:MAG: hypothetical protein ACO2PN_29150 [Pyrobaculum sp.]|jgi:hypothetical protein
MSKRAVRVEKVAKNRVLAELEGGSVAIFDLMRMPDGPKVYFVTLLDRNGKVVASRVIPVGYADQ